MRPGAVLLATVVLTLSCGGSPPSAVHSPSPRPSSSAAASASPTAAPLTGPYGLILSAGILQLINLDGSVAATASVNAPTVQFCTSAHDGVVMPPPVSATSDAVYFRDGDTKIRMVVPPGGAADVTTVPGGPTTISFFSVSPDDQRIAVLVEDLSGSTNINLRLYVEDLRGGGHHADIFTTTTPKGKSGATLWPMGWHEGLLVLAVIVACTFEPAGLSPSEWHVVDASTAVRKAAIGSLSCVPSYWPSAAGVACVDHTKLTATRYDWTGQVIGTIPTGANDYQSGMSPTGGGTFFTTGVGIGAPPPSIRILGRTASVTVPGHTACLWMDDGTLLAPDAVIQFPSGTVLPIPASGVCAGRFPGGL